MACTRPSPALISATVPALTCGTGVLSVFPIRSPHNSVQLAMIQPVEAAVLAVIDDHVAASAVEVRVHSAPALRTGDAPIQIPRLERTSHVPVAFPAGLEILNHCRENTHRDQHAVTSLAVQQPQTSGSRMY
jgi:hypothetical protein